MSVSKAERERVYAMFDGRCAYCGRDLPARWHVDHLEPVMRVALTGHYSDGLTMLNPERDTPSNYMPACPSCNIDKHRMTLERWREWLTVRLGALRKTPGWRLLEAHGQVQATGAPIVFHFETALTTKDSPHG